MRVVFRTEGGSSVGMGHLSRCLSLSHAIAEEAEVVFIVNKEVSDYVRSQGYDALLSDVFNKSDITKIRELKPDLIIVDSYHANSNYVDSLRRIAKVALFDDNGEHNPITAHCVINGNLHAFEINYEKARADVSFLLGPEFLVMKPEYWCVETDSISEGEGILITVGGADFHHLIPRFMGALKELPLVKRLIVGPFVSSKELHWIEKHSEGFEIIWKPTSLKRHIERSKLVLTAAGSTVYEVLLLGRQLTVYSLAENQIPIARALARYGIPYLGEIESLNWREFPIKIKREYSKSNTITLNAKAIGLDGKGALRLKEKLLRGGC